MPKLSGSVGFSRRATRSATVASSMAASSTSGLDGFDQQRQRLSRAEQPHVGAERDDGEAVLRLPERRAPLLADADDAELDAGNADGLVERIRLPEQAVGDVPADDGDRPAALDLRRRHHPALLGVEVREVRVLAGDAR